MRNTIWRWSQWVWILATIALAFAIVGGVCALWEPILQAAGRALIVDEQLSHADIIVVAIDAGAGGFLEAADLVHKGVSARVAIFIDPPNLVDREFIRRGLPYFDEAAWSVRVLRGLGVNGVVQIPRVEGTEDEGRVLPAWCVQHQFHSVVLVCSFGHSRRVRRVLRRSMKGFQTQVSIRVSRYSDFDEDRWWTTRDGARYMIIEFEKLLLDVVRHPLS